MNWNYLKNPDNPWIDLFFGCWVGAWLFATVILTWKYPLLTTFLLIFVLIAQLKFRPHTKDHQAMIIAALLGTPAEAVSVYLGEWRYHNTDLIWGLPLWIPLIWANLFALYRRLTRFFIMVLEQTLAEKNLFLHPVLWNILGLSIAIYCFTALALMQKTAIVYLLYAGFLIAMAGFWHQKEDLLIFFIGAILGTLGEFVCVQLGYWSYFNPYFKQFGIDITLALDWGLSSVIINRLAKQNFKK